MSEARVCSACGSAILDGEHLRDDLEPCYGSRIRVIVAGNHWEANNWCRENNVDYNRTVVIASDRDARRLQGMKFTKEQVAYVGTWEYNSGISPLTYGMIKSRILTT